MSDKGKKKLKKEVSRSSQVSRSESSKASTVSASLSPAQTEEEILLQQYDKEINEGHIENIMDELETSHLDIMDIMTPGSQPQRVPLTEELEKSQAEVAAKQPEDEEVVVKEAKPDKITQQPGKHILYSKYVDQGASVVKQSKKVFVFELASQSEGSSIGEHEHTHVPKAEGAGDFTYGYHENRQYILPNLTEHETQRLGCNKFLEDVVNIGQHIDFRDHIALCLSYLTVITKSYLIETFKQISAEMKLIGKVYSARMLAFYHEYAKMFKFSAGREGGMVASMRFTSHCSDIIKSYIHLAEYLENPTEFSNIIYELAKRHYKLGLKLRDHQVHFKPFAEIIGSWHEDPMKTYCALIFFLSLVSRSMMKAEIGIKDSKGDNSDVLKIATRSVRTTEPKKEVSRKQPTWD